MLCAILHNLFKLLKCKLFVFTSHTPPLPPYTPPTTPTYHHSHFPTLHTSDMYSVSQCDYRCPPPPIPANGRLANIYPLSSNSSTFVLGTVAVFVCDTGFYLAGSASRTCRENGVWSDQVTRCYPCKHCDHVIALDVSIAIM